MRDVLLGGSDEAWADGRHAATVRIGPVQVAVGVEVIDNEGGAHGAVEGVSGAAEV